MFFFSLLSQLIVIFLLFILISLFFFPSPFVSFSLYFATYFIGIFFLPIKFLLQILFILFIYCTQYTQYILVHLQFTTSTTYFTAFSVRLLLLVLCCLFFFAEENMIFPVTQIFSDFLVFHVFRVQGKSIDRCLFRFSPDALRQPQAPTELDWTNDLVKITPKARLMRPTTPLFDAGLQTGRQTDRCQPQPAIFASSTHIPSLARSH